MYVAQESKQVVTKVVSLDGQNGRKHGGKAIHLKLNFFPFTYKFLRIKTDHKCGCTC